MSITFTKLDWADPHLARIDLPKGTMRLTRSLASGLCQSAHDAPNVFWGVGDRGPNIKPRTAAKDYGCDHLLPLAEIDGAKVMPLPEAGPAIARFRIDGHRILLEEVLELTDAQGQAIGGLPVPHGPHAEFEPIFDLSGTRLAPQSGGADSEGITALPDGSFWVSEEYGPSLLHVDRTGRVLMRWVPHGQAHCFAETHYPVLAVLPALASARKLNRGFEAIAAAPDGASLLVAFQSPLAHPNREAHERSRHLRLWQLDGATGALLAEYVYPLDRAETFRRDAEAGDVKRDDLKVSEMIWTADGTVLVLERISLTTKIYAVRLSPDQAAPAALADPATRPTLEQMSSRDLEQAGIPILAKRLILSTDDHPQVSADLEGMILLAPDRLLLVNDSDFGIEGAETQFWMAELGERIKLIAHSPRPS